MIVASKASANGVFDTLLIDAQMSACMAGQVSALYFQTYQLAFDMARRAERAFRFELGLFDDQRTFTSVDRSKSATRGRLKIRHQRAVPETGDIYLGASP